MKTLKVCNISTKLFLLKYKNCAYLKLKTVSITAGKFLIFLHSVLTTGKNTKKSLFY